MYLVTRVPFLNYNGAFGKEDDGERRQELDQGLKRGLRPSVKVGHLHFKRIITIYSRIISRDLGTPIPYDYFPVWYTTIAVLIQ